jgi:hypothetical protein
VHGQSLPSCPYNIIQLLILQFEGRWKSAFLAGERQIAKLPFGVRAPYLDMAKPTLAVQRIAGDI